MKKAIQRSLGLRPTREELIQSYFQTRQTRDNCQEDLNQAQSIIQNLQDLYNMSKDEFPVWRYFTLKHVVTVTVADFMRMRELRQVRLELTRKRTATSGSGPPEEHSATSAMARLKGNALAIAKIQKEVEQWKELSADMEEQRTNEIIKQCEQTVGEVLILEQDYRAACHRLENLAESQMWADRMCCCCSRYMAYDEMITEALTDDAITARPSRS